MIRHYPKVQSSWILSPIQKFKLASLAHAKTREEMLKSHIVDNELLNIASSILQKIMPTYIKDTLDSPSRKLKKLINSISTHFESLEKSVDFKVQNEFDAKRFCELQRMIANDRSLLDTCKKYPRCLIRRWLLAKDTAKIFRCCHLWKPKLVIPSIVCDLILLKVKLEIYFSPVSQIKVSGRVKHFG